MSIQRMITDAIGGGGDNVTCKPDYMPTVPEYREAFGGYSIAAVTIGSIITTLLFLLFFYQMWFTFANTHKLYRRHIYWLISIYPFVTLLSTLALVVPRAHNLCNAVKITYMCIGVAHFADLTLKMYGSENKMIEGTKNTPMRFDLLPLCCFFKCLPTTRTSKWSLRIAFALCSQMPFTQFAYYFIIILLRYAQVDTTAVFLSLSILNFASFLSGVYALNIMCDLAYKQLHTFRYRSKSLAVKMLILTTKLQSFLFDVLGNNDVFPCTGPLLTSVAYQSTIENSIFLVEMLVFGVFSYFMYRRVEFKDIVDLPLSTRPASNGIDGPGTSEGEDADHRTKSEGVSSFYSYGSDRDSFSGSTKAPTNIVY